MTRGRSVLDTMIRILETYGYAVAETTHDCGELGNLAQTGKRFLLVARHREKVPPFLYEPPRRPLRAVGDILNTLPLPGAEEAGPMHRMRTLQWRTWVRLAFVRAGSDWRSLQGLRVTDGHLADYALVPEHPWNADALRVGQVGDPALSGVPQYGAFAVGDPRRTEGRAEFGQYGVKRWDETSQTVIGKAAVGAGHFAVADPRTIDRTNRDYQTARHYGVISWDQHSLAVTGSACHDNGAFTVADPRLPDNDARHLNQWRVERWDTPCHTIVGATRPGSGALCVGDPREIDTASPSPIEDSIAGSHIENALPSADTRLVAVIRALDGTCHRPFTTLELSALQGLVDPQEYLELHGNSDSAWRERIGNAVPSPAAEAIASVMAETLLLAMSGETFLLNATPIWVHPIAAALSVDIPVAALQ